MDSTRQSHIIFAAFNARYAHTSFGARAQPRIAVEKILAHNPRIISIGCYIWNIELVTKVAALLKSIRPDIKLILGGPEISYETEEQEIFQYADHVICGEGELEFPKLCNRILNPEDGKSTKIIRAEPVDVAQIELPSLRILHVVARSVRTLFPGSPTVRSLPTPARSRRAQL
jgi:radical SAM superfamily enzyme YgiQ (UPF0313 family)